MGDLAHDVHELFPRLRAELEELVRIPSVAFEGFPEEPVRAAGEAVARLLRATGLPEVRMVDVPRAPQAVYGARPAQPGAPTVLLYAHYDVQPAGDESAWATPPFEPVERDGRLYGRGAADDKGGIISHVGALLALGPDSPLGVKVLIEGQEEVGLGGIEELVRAEPELLAADVVVVSDVGNFAVGVPTLTTSLRGMASLDVEVETLAGAVHSGSFGGVAPDALVALARMLATLHDEAGDVAVAGLDRVAYDGAAYDEQAFRADAGVLPGVGLIGTGSVAERLLARPSVTVVGLDAPAVDGARNALVPRARARVSARLAPGQDPRAAQEALRRHLERVAPWGVKLTFTPRAAGRGYLADTSGPVHAAAMAALEEAYGRPAVTYGEGGSIPLVAAFREVLGAEIVLWGVEEPRCRVHAPDESVDLTELEHCALAEALLLRTLAGG